MDEMWEWHNSFVLVPIPNGKVRLCLNPTRLNIRPVHRGPTLNVAINNIQMQMICDIPVSLENGILMVISYKYHI